MIFFRKISELALLLLFTYWQLLCVTKAKRKRERVVCVFVRFSPFSHSNMNTAPTTAIATIMPADAGTKYNSAADAGVGDGSVVACVLLPRLCKCLQTMAHTIWNLKT
jgi:hypothetical protein